MNLLDINACFGHWQYWDLRHKTPADLVRSMDAVGIERAAVMSLRGLVLDWREGNAETLAAAEPHPTRLIPMATISPFLGGDGGELRRLVDVGMRGVRLYPTFHNYALDSEFANDVCATAAECEIPVMIPTRPMMNWRFAPLPIDSIAAVARRHAQTTIILSGPNYLVEFQAVVHVMQECDNVMFEISCLQGFDCVRKLVEAVGAERVLFGTGAVLNYPACNVEKLAGASISKDKRRAIASENAVRLLRLEV